MKPMSFYFPIRNILVSLLKYSNIYVAFISGPDGELIRGGAVKRMIDYIGY